MTSAVAPLRYLDASTVAGLCAGIDPVEVVTAAFRAVRAGHAGVTPEAALRWTAADGTAARSLILPAWHADAYGCKIINACLGNVERGLPRAQGLIVLFDPDTAAPVCLMEGARVSALRTAAVSVAALGAIRDLTDVHEVAFLGCGRQARTHLELLATRARLTRVIVHDSDPARAKAFVDEIGVAAGPVDTPEEAVRAAEVVIAATTTTTPYVPLDWLPAGAVFVNVSLDDAEEDLLLGCDHLIVDDWPLVGEDETRLLGRLAHAGRVSGPADPRQTGVRQVDADLPTLLSGGYPRPIGSADRVVVNPFGMGVHDLALATRIHAAARRDDVGVQLPR